MYNYIYKCILLQYTPYVDEILYKIILSFLLSWWDFRCVLCEGQLCFQHLFKVQM